MGLSDVMDAVSREAKTLVALNKIRPHMQTVIPELLRGMGADLVKRLIAGNISLWQIWPSEDKEKILADVSKHREDVLSINLDAFVDMTMDVIRQRCPEFSFISRSWIVLCLQDLKRDSRL